MARTTNGNLRGAAARTQKAEQRERLITGSGISQSDAYVLLLTTIEGDKFTQWWKSISPTLAPTDQYQTLQQRFERVKDRLGLAAVTAHIVGG